MVLVVGGLAGITGVYLWFSGASTSFDAMQVERTVPPPRENKGGLAAHLPVVGRAPLPLRCVYVSPSQAPNFA
jgi:hypothetical protein